MTSDSTETNDLILSELEEWLKTEQYDTSIDEFYIRAIQAAQYKLDELKEKYR